MSDPAPVSNLGPLKIDLESPVPRYHQLSQQLQHDIATGRFKPGEQFPSERALARLSGLTQVTVRQALAELEHAGLLRREHGRGSFVAREFKRKRSRGPAQRVTLLCFDLAGDLAEGYGALVAEVLAGCEDVLGPLDAVLSVVDVRPGTRQEAERKVFETGPSSGLLLLGGWNKLRDIWDIALAQKIPHAVLDEPPPAENSSPKGGQAFFADTQAGGRLVGAALRSQAPQAIGYLGRDNLRLRGFRAGLADQASKLAAACVILDHAVTAVESERAGYAGALRLLRDSAPRVSAVFAANDYRALGALRAFAERGVRVPRDVALVGFDDLPDCTRCQPPLASVRLPHREAAAAACRAVLQWHEAPQDYQPEFRPIDPVLIPRESLGGLGNR